MDICRRGDGQASAVDRDSANNQSRVLPHVLLKRLDDLKILIADAVYGQCSRRTHPCWSALLVMSPRAEESSVWRQGEGWRSVTTSGR